MRQQIYAIFDTVSSKQLGPLLLLPREAAAIRLFQEVAAAGDTDLNRYPEDFILLHLGEIDEESSQITPITPNPVYSGVAYVKAKRLAELNAKVAPAPANGADASTTLLTQQATDEAKWDSEERLYEEFNKRRLELRQRINS